MQGRMCSLKSKGFLKPSQRANARKQVWGKLSAWREEPRRVKAVFPGRGRSLETSLPGPPPGVRSDRLQCHAHFHLISRALTATKSSIAKHGTSYAR
jgi:hypothetical protein